MSKHEITRTMDMVIRVPHDDSSWHDWIIEFSKDQYNGSIVARDSIGRKNPNMSMYAHGQQWLNLRCNSTECPARAYINLRTLLEGHELPEGTGHS